MTSERECARVLLLTFARRDEEQPIREALAHLARAYPGSCVYAVATPVSAQVLRNLWVADLVLYQGLRSARAVVAQVAARRPRAAAILYCTDRPHGHLKLELLALLSGAPTIHRCFPGAGPQVIGRARLLGSVVAKLALAASTFVAAMMAAAVAFLLLVLCQGLTGKRRAAPERRAQQCG